MEKYSGISMVKGIASGRIYLCKKTDYEVTDQRVPDIDAEMERFLEWGVDELSVVPSAVLKLREAVRALP